MTPVFNAQKIFSRLFPGMRFFTVFDFNISLASAGTVL